MRLLVILVTESVWCLHYSAIVFGGSKWYKQ